MIKITKVGKQQLLEDSMCLSKTQNLMRVVATDYKVLGSSHPLDAPNEPKTVTQHPDRFWTLCFDDTC